MSDTTRKDNELRMEIIRKTSTRMSLSDVDIVMQIVKQYGIQERIDERNRVSYEHESFTHEWFKDRVRNLKVWWYETASDAHTRRIESLNRELTALKDAGADTRISNDKQETE